MTTRRLAALFLILCAGLGAVGFVPRVQYSQPAGIELALPAALGEWRGRNAAVSDSERTELGPETEFVRKLYRNAGGQEIFVSVVLAGRDMNTSIHRPERCLPSQGWKIAGAGTRRVRLDGSRALAVTRLRNLRPAKDGKMFCCLDYYWFVGCKETTPSHTTRMFIDLRDRLLKGCNQRWAYISILAAVPGGFDSPSEKQADEMMAAFIRQLLPKVQKPDVT